MIKKVPVLFILSQRLLTVTALSSVMVLLFYVWSFSIFFSSNYKSDVLLEPLIRYVSNLLPLLACCFFGILAYVKKNYLWLMPILLLQKLAIFYRVGASWVLRGEVFSTDMVRDFYAWSNWPVFIFLSLAIVTFCFSHYERYRTQFFDLPLILRGVLYFIVIVVAMDFLVAQYTIYVWSPMVYMTTKTVAQQIDIVFMGGISYLLLALLAFYAVYSKYYYLLLIHFALAPYKLWISTTAIIPNIEKSWEEINVLAHSSMYASIVHLLLFISTILAFFVWFFYDKYKFYKKIQKQNIVI